MKTETSVIDILRDLTEGTEAQSVVDRHIAILSKHAGNPYSAALKAIWESLNTTRDEKGKPVSVADIVSRFESFHKTLDLYIMGLDHELAQLVESKTDAETKALIESAHANETVRPQGNA